MKISAIKRHCEKTRAYARKLAARWRNGDLARDEFDHLMVYEGRGLWMMYQDGPAYAEVSRKIKDGPTP